MLSRAVHKLAVKKLSDNV